MLDVAVAVLDLGLRKQLLEKGIAQVREVGLVILVRGKECTEVIAHERLLVPHRWKADE